jgi:hypothetical protein
MLRESGASSNHYTINGNRPAQIEVQRLLGRPVKPGDDIIENRVSEAEH